MLVITALGMALFRLWRRHQRLQREHTDKLQELQRNFELVLWAGGEQYWELELPQRLLRRTRIRISGEGSERQWITSTETEAADPTLRIHPEDSALVRERMLTHLRGHSDAFRSEHRIRGSDGNWKWVRAHGRCVETDTHGRATKVCGISHPIDAQRLDKHREWRIGNRLRKYIDEAAAVLDQRFNFISVNPAFCKISGYREEDIIGRNASQLDSPQHDIDFYHAIRNEVIQHGYWSGEVWQRRKDGEEFLSTMQCIAIPGDGRSDTCYLSLFDDITEYRRTEQELRYLANYDTLTNLPNRALLSERLSRAIVRARRQDARLAVLFLDFDHFKDINDSLGHAAGDRILRAAATRLQDTVGVQPTVARVGGDEFTILLEGIQSPENADHIARELIMAFDAPLLLDDRVEVSLSASIGISLYPDHGHIPTELLKQADTAMYQAKAAGRHTFARYNDSMEVMLRNRATVSSALRKVLDRGELRLVFQPRMSLPRKRIVGVEALLRWYSAEHGEVPPSQFIPLAEESGLILEMGEWVLREACLTLRQWQQAGLKDLSISVNVSALQLLRGDFPVVVERVLAETRIPPRLLELELTESVIMASPEQTAAKLHSFRQTGVSLAIDDFGTGYSSLAYLRRLPITTLKIDKEFIGELSNDADNASITTTVIAMAKSLRLNVVAEGVETAEQLRFLAKHGCDEVQGYWLSPPLESNACLQFLHSWNPDLLAGSAGH